MSENSVLKACSIPNSGYCLTFAAMTLDKVQIHDHCLSVLKNQVEELRSALSGASEGFEGSSSAGDKHNTEAAMLHLEQEKKASQLEYAVKNLALLGQINPEKRCDQIQLGALAQTNKGWFYFAGPIGKIEIDDHSLMVLSVGSPIGRVLAKMKLGESVCFNKELWVVEGIL